jgi:sulfur-carrier protein adenylyltransferase/sulfurtransferase
MIGEDMSMVALTPEKLRRFMEQRHEKEYALIDVRQPGEYEDSHIPGALLIPLPDLVRTMDAVPTDRELIFYCRNGGRSQAAATMVADEEITRKALYHLDGGVMAWQGRTTAGFPRIRIFKDSDSVAEKLRTAMDLEKGALIYYSRIHDLYSDRPWSTVFSELARAERGHARIVFGFLRGLEAVGEDFEAVFDRLPGDVLEGGMSLDTALQKVAAVKGRICLHLIELALQLENQAYDLYRAAADQSIENHAREAFWTIAQAEKGHMRSLAGALGSCSRDA